MALLLDQMLSRLLDEGEDEGLAQESDDEEYVYVSRLAEQIASHAMLQDDEDAMDFPPVPPALPSNSSQKPQELTHHFTAASRRGLGRPLTQFENCQLASWPAVAPAVSWSEHGLYEDELVRRRNVLGLHQNLVSARHLQSAPYLLQKETGWHSYTYQQRAADMSHQMSASPRQVTCLTPASTVLQRKDSVGTGVFLPKVLTSSSQSRRKFGMFGKSAYTARSKGEYK